MPTSVFIIAMVSLFEGYTVLFTAFEVLQLANKTMKNITMILIVKFLINTPAFSKY